MSINDIKPTELARHRQNVNPAKVSLQSSHGAAYRDNRDAADNKAIAALESLDVNSAVYFDELLEGGNHETS